VSTKGYVPLALTKKGWRCAERIHPSVNDAAVGFRRRDADWCDRDGRAPRSFAKSLF